MIDDDPSGCLKVSFPSFYHDKVPHYEDIINWFSFVNVFWLLLNLLKVVHYWQDPLRHRWSLSFLFFLILFCHWLALFDARQIFRITGVMRHFDSSSAKDQKRNQSYYYYRNNNAMQIRIRNGVVGSVALSFLSLHTSIHSYTNGFRSMMYIKYRQDVLFMRQSIESQSPAHYY